jgi:hypothetical protein
MLRRMALIHNATVTPSKLELITPWLPAQSWYTGPAGEAQRVASFRLDDPAGAVGIEVMLVRVGDGPVHQVPLTYRHAPLPGADDSLLNTAEHSVLGKRWIYDGTHDPLYAAALAAALLGNTGQAEQFVDVDGTLERREPSMSVASNAPNGTPVPAVGMVQRVVDGDPTVIVTDTVELTVLRQLGTSLAGTVLTGTWPGQTTPLPLAAATLH